MADKRSAHRPGGTVGEAPPDPTWPVQVAATPRASVHHSPQSGRTTAIVDFGTRLVDIMIALGDVGPGVRLVESTVNGESAVLVFVTGTPDEVSE
ncbi:hypothetical protein [Frankia tisae]|uniref:hypothetical protein n=1 Tax=Frankia tisae TaxID=2950104 RepID=UPI0021BE853B|nr:hypothetical protein [Frankia tisae]